MEVPEDILEVLKCSKCEGLLCRSPVYLCTDGKGLCNICYSDKPPPPVPATRNPHYEAVAKLLLFPCKNQDEGCKVKVPFNNSSEHEEVCSQRKYVCPILGSSACDWFGTAAHIQAHCEQQHANRVLDNPTTFTHDITKSSSHTYLLRAFQLLFLLFTKVCVKSGKIYYSIRYLGSSSDAQNFKYTVNIMRGDETVIKKGKVAPQGCLAIQEDSSLILNINSLLSIFDRFNDTAFFVTLERLGEKCSKCDILLTVKDYSDSDGWKCKNCAPKKVLCANNAKGCTYESYPKKCIQHENYFCNFANYCFNCAKSVNDQFLIHCSKEHFKCSNGTVWRASGRKSEKIIYTIHSDAGTGVCTYMWTNSCFNFWIHIPLSNIHLINFLCTVKVIHVATGQTRTYYPNPVYDSNYDWFVKVADSEFSDWSDTFDISVSIRKIKQVNYLASQIVRTIQYSELLTG